MSLPSNAFGRFFCTLVAGLFAMFSHIADAQLSQLPAGRVVAWGDNSLGQTNVPTATDVVAISANGECCNLALRANGEIVPSKHALWAKELGLPVVTWTLERSSLLADGDNGFYFKTIDAAITREGDVMRVLDVLAREVGVRGVFSDWPATVTFYASCMGLN